MEEGREGEREGGRRRDGRGEGGREGGGKREGWKRGGREEGREGERREGGRGGREGGRGREGRGEGGRGRGREEERRIVCNGTIGQREREKDRRGRAIKEETVKEGAKKKKTNSATIDNNRSEKFFASYPQMALQFTKTMCYIIISYRGLRIDLQPQAQHRAVLLPG